MTKRKMNNQPGLFDSDPKATVASSVVNRKAPSGFQIGDHVRWGKGYSKWTYIVEAIYPTRIVCAGPGGSTLSTTPDMLEKI